LFLHAPGCGVALSPPKPRAQRPSISGTRTGGNLETRASAQTSKFLVPISPFLEPGARIGGNRATPQQVACSAARVSLGGGHSRLGRYPATSLPFCQRPRPWSAATFGMPMTNNKGPQVRLAWAYRAVLCDREVLGQQKVRLATTAYTPRTAPNWNVLCIHESVAYRARWCSPLSRYEKSRRQLWIFWS
jgi:hypothetical protein